jgi:hypothetical protein
LFPAEFLPASTLRKKNIKEKRINADRSTQ